MAAKVVSSTSATYYAAGNSNMRNCANKTGIPGISMHYLPRNELYDRSRFGLPEFTGNGFKP